MDSDLKNEEEHADAVSTKVIANRDDVRKYSEFAEMCSFLELFHKDFEIYFTFKQLSEILSDNQSVPNNWSTLHIKLLSKLKRKATLDKWTRSLHRFISNLSSTDEKILHIAESLNKQDLSSNEVYLSIKPKDKAFIFLMLLQSQSDYNENFKTKMASKNECLEYRRQPLGQDILGKLYWMFVDHEFNFLLYKEDTEEEILEFITEDFEEAKSLAFKLESEFPPDQSLQKVLGTDNNKSPNVKEEEEDLKQINQRWDEDCENLDIKPEVPESIGSESMTSEDLPCKEEVDEQSPVNDKPDDEVKHEKIVDTKKEEEESPQNHTLVDNTEENSDQVTPKKKSKKENSLDDSAELSLRRSGRSRKPVAYFTPEVKSNKRSSSSKKNKKAEKEILKIVKTVEKNSKKKTGGKRGRARGKNNSDAEEETDDEAFLQELEETQNNAEDFSDASTSSVEIESESDDDDEDFKEAKIGRNLLRHKNMKKIQTEKQEETPCQICSKSDRPEWLLLCDECDLGHHAMCLTPALLIIPDGDWFCPRCCHKKLIDSIRTRISDLETQQKEHTVKKKMEDRLKFINISMSNIISAGDRAAKDKAGLNLDNLAESSQEEEDDGESAEESENDDEKDNSDYVPDVRLRPRSSKAGTRSSGRIKSRSRQYSSDCTSESDPDYDCSSRRKKAKRPSGRVSSSRGRRSGPSKPQRKRRKKFIDDDSVEEDLSYSDASSVPEVKSKRRAATKVVSYNINEVYKAVDSEFSDDEEENVKPNSNGQSGAEDEDEECGPDGRPKLHKTNSPLKSAPRIGKKKKTDDDSGEDFVPDDDSTAEESDPESEDEPWSQRRQTTRSGRNVRPTKKLRVAFSGDESDDYAKPVKRKKSEPTRMSGRSRVKSRYNEDSTEEEDEEEPKSDEEEEETPNEEETEESDEIDEAEDDNKEEDKKCLEIDEDSPTPGCNGDSKSHDQQDQKSSNVKKAPSPIRPTVKKSQIVDDDEECVYSEDEAPVISDQD